MIKKANIPCDELFRYLGYAKDTEAEAATLQEQAILQGLIWLIQRDLRREQERDADLRREYGVPPGSAL